MSVIDPQLRVQVWVGDRWEDAGPLRGEQGPQGDKGESGVLGVVAEDFMSSPSDAAGLQAAIERASDLGQRSATRCWVYLSPGETYPLGAGLQAHSQVGIWGNGATVIQGFDGTLIAGENLEGFALYGGRYTGTPGMADTSNILRLTGGRTVDVRGCVFDAYRGRPIQTFNIRDVVVESNRFLSCGAFAARLEGNASAQVGDCDNFVIRNNYIEGATSALVQHAYKAFTATISTTAGSKIVTVTAGDAPAEGAWDGLRVHGQVRPGTVLVSGSGTGTWKLSRAAPSTVSGDTAVWLASRYARVESNLWVGSFTANVISLQYAQDFTVRNNELRGTGAPAGNSIALGNAVRGRVEHNTLSNPGNDGINAPSAYEILYASNIIRNPARSTSRTGVGTFSGITMSTVANDNAGTIVQDNVIVDDLADGMAFGIANVGDTRLIDNYVSGWRTGRVSGTPAFQRWPE